MRRSHAGGSGRALLWAGAVGAGLAVTLTTAGTQAAPGSVQVPSIRAPQVTTTVTAQTFALRLDEAQVRATTAAQWATLARTSTVIVLNSWDYSLIPVLKHANPHVQVWVYKDLSGVRSDDCTTASGQCGACPPGAADSGLLSSGMGYCWLRQNHPGWLLRSASTGQPFQFRGYPNTWETDYGSAAYQAQWASNVIADVRAHGWDGVEVDNALTISDAYGVARKYPTDTAVQQATYSALRRIGAALHQAHVRSVFNVGYATRFPGLWRRWLNVVGGLEQEFYLSYSTSPDAGGLTWDAYQAEVSSCVSLHKSCWFHAGDYSSGVTSQTRTYALASLLLAADDRQLIAVGDMAASPVPAWARASSPGTGSEVLLGTAWRRTLSWGVAAVNPAPVPAVVPLGGTYLDSTGQPVTSVALAPDSGAVLRLAPPPTPPPSPATTPPSPSVSPSPGPSPSPAGSVSSP